MFALDSDLSSDLGSDLDPDLDYLGVSLRYHHTLTGTAGYHPVLFFFVTRFAFFGTCVSYFKQ